MDNYVKEFKENLEKYKDGKFEIYRTPNIGKNERQYENYQYTINSIFSGADLESGENFDRYFAIFICLMIRYTQNKKLIGIGIDERENQEHGYYSIHSYDHEDTFKDILKEVINKKQLLKLENNQYNTDLYSIKKCCNCVFFYTQQNLLNNKLLNDLDLDLYFRVVQESQRIILSIIYDQNLFDSKRISNMALHYEKFIECITNHPNEPIFKVNFLSSKERQYLIDDWNKTEFDFPKGSSIPELFEKKVQEDPNAIALYYEDFTMSRKELDICANKLANKLIQDGAKKGDIIAIYSNKNRDFVVGILGILKAGCAYMPIDSTYPKARVNYMIGDSKVKILISTTKIKDIENLKKTKLLMINLENIDLRSYSEKKPNVDIDSKSPCYLIYTSGSTGKPKGVLLNHEGRINNFYDFNSRFSITEEDRILAVSSVGFDMSAYDILGSLMAGTGIVLPNPHLEKQPFYLIELIEKYKVTIWHSVPILLEIICKCCIHRREKALGYLRLVLLGGDWIPLTLPKMFRSLNKQARLISLGGATEVSMDSTIYEIEDVNLNWNSIPYGKPMRNQKAYILDENRQMLPIGMPGELYLGGIGVAEGYYLKPDETREKFFQNPWGKNDRERIYKTGDIAYFNMEGYLILLGRKDFQVKINGTRIELGEIEHTLLNYKGVNKAIAIAPKIGNTRKIVLYIEYKDERCIPEKEEVLGYLRDKLPNSHVPAHIFFTDRIPTTPNRKIDRKILEKLTNDFFNVNSFEKYCN